MKSSNTVVTVIVIAAVLVAAYGVGLLVQRARQGNSRPATSGVVDANRTSGKAEALQKPGMGQTGDTPESRAKVKEKRAEALEKMESATEQQKKEFREKVREQVGGKRTSQTPDANADVAQDHPPIQDPNTKQNRGGAGAEPNAGGQG
ncbi:MAG: hypothetical protein ACM3VT_17360 [Solirubrobacterales bacterium]